MRYIIMSHLFSYPYELCQCLLQPVEFLSHGVHGDCDSFLILSWTYVYVLFNYKLERVGKGRKEGPTNLQP